MNSKIKILWIAFSVPSVLVGHAGGKTFRYYFNAFRDDKHFDIRLIGFQEHFDIKDLDIEFTNIPHDFIQRGDRVIDRIKNWRDILGKVCGTHGGLILSSRANFIFDKLKEYKSAGYNPDVIILEWTAIGVLAKEIHRIYPKTLIYMSEYDITFQSAFRKLENKTGLNKVFAKVSAKRIYAIEKDTLNEADVIVVQNDKDADILQKESVKSEKILKIAPYYHRTTMPHHRTNNHILFFGYMLRNENKIAVKWFIDNVMPRITDINCIFTVIGAGAKEAFKKCYGVNVQIIGYVDSIDKYFSEAMCLVSPLTIGAGIKVKVIEAMYAGLPVLTNSVGIEGISAISGKDYFHCETPEDYENVIRDLYTNKIKTEDVSYSAKQTIEKNFPLEESVEVYKNDILCRLEQRQL